MRRWLRVFPAIILTATFLFSTYTAPKARADTFNPNQIISAPVFDNYGTMSPTDINNFLNSFPNSCISPNSGFTSIDPIGYNPTDGFIYGGYASAGQVIYDAAQAYGINPQVLLSTTQKEQSLVAGGAGYCDNGDEHKYAAAMGYGCPDGGTRYSYSGVNLYARNGVTHWSVNPTCVNSVSKVGFSQQMIRAAWLLKFGEQRAQGNVGWAVVKGNWNNSDDPQTCYGGPMTTGNFQRCPNTSTTYYDGYTTIDGSAVHMDNGATAALYWYTPHFSGNQNFFNIFQNWFGSPYVSAQPWQWQLADVSPFVDSGRTRPFNHGNGGVSLAPGGKAYIRVKARNMGYQTWTQSVVRLGATRPQDRCSAFADGTWLSCGRIAMQESSVAPGETATFDFTLTAPSQVGSYQECFNVVAEGITWLNDQGVCFGVDVLNQRSASSEVTSTLGSGSMLRPGDYLESVDRQSVFRVQDDGNTVLYTDFKPTWYTGMQGNVDRLVMQTDGNLVLYNKSNQPLWASGTNGNPGAYFAIQTDGNAVIYSASNVPLWASGTNGQPDGLSYVNHYVMQGDLLPMQELRTANGKYTLIFQGDGNLVLYSQSRALWASGTENRGAASVSMQGDGNLVVYNKNHQALWHSHTYGQGVSRLVMQDDGNLVIYNSANRPTWNTGTQGQN
jgi:hypothetical protein